MKSVFIAILIGFLPAAFLCAQTNTSPNGDIVLTVVTPDNVDGLSATQLSKLQTKVVQLTNQSGASGVNYSQPFVIYPKFEIESSDVDDAGLTNITVVKCSFSMFIKQWQTDVIFSTYSKEVTGSGNSKESAVSNAISSVRTTDADIKSFFDAGKQKIIQYYTNNCSTIIQQANASAAQNKYDEALALLNSVPSQAGDCYSKAQQTADKIFIDYQNYTCHKILTDAKAQEAGHNYNESLNDLSQIDPKSNCSAEAKALLNEVGTKVDAEEKKQYDLIMKEYSDDIALEKERITAISQIAVAYYSSQPRAVNYTTVIK